MQANNGMLTYVRVQQQSICFVIPVISPAVLGTWARGLHLQRHHHRLPLRYWQCHLHRQHLLIALAHSWLCSQSVLCRLSFSAQSSIDQQHQWWVNLFWPYESNYECCCRKSPPLALQHKCEASVCHKTENILFECSFISLYFCHMRRHACNRCRRSFVCVARRAEQARWGLGDPTRRPGANAGALRQGAQSLRHDHASEYASVASSMPCGRSCSMPHDEAFARAPKPSYSVSFIV